MIMIMIMIIWGIYCAKLGPVVTRESRVLGGGYQILI